MKLRRLEAFREVMRSGNVTRAAASLSISQPAVSRLLRDLEAEIGMKLFERSSGRIRATVEAERFMEIVEQSFVGLESLKRAADEIAGSRGVQLRVAVFAAIALGVMPAVLARFRAAVAGTFAAVHVTNSSRVLDLVSTSQVDIGFSALPGERSGVAVLHRLELECVCAVPSGHRLALARRIVRDDLRGETLIALDSSAVSSAPVRAMLIDTRIVGEVAYEVSSSYPACELVRLKQGVAIVDPLTALAFPGEGVRFKPFRPSIPFGIAVVRPAYKAVSLATQRFVDTYLTVSRELNLPTKTRGEFQRRLLTKRKRS